MSPHATESASKPPHNRTGNPIVEVEGVLQRFDTMPREQPEPPVDVFREEAHREDGNLFTSILAVRVFDPLSNSSSYFLPYKHLASEMTRPRVRRALRDEFDIHDENKLNELSSKIVPDGLPRTYEPFRSWPDGQGPGRQPGYIITFATLLRCGRGGAIQDFVECCIGDDELPLKSDMRNLGLPCLVGSRGGRTKALNLAVVDPFPAQQWQLVPPFFALGTDGTVPHYELPPTIVFPWIEKSNAKQSGHATVMRVKIHDACHDFHPLLDSMLLEDRSFAIKTLIGRDVAGFEARFRKEVRMLTRFSGRSHPHLVTLLATYAWNGEYNFIFPWAKYDLDKFWASNGSPPKDDLEYRRWVSEQVAGLVDAMHAIHEPPSGTLLPDKPFGRHGDIKPENILVFSRRGNLRDTMVITDFGLTEVHGDASRSNQPGESIPHTPGYRPPECDVKGGKVSRAFDTWTLGCLLLEMVCWLLEGSRGREKFKERRKKLYITGSMDTIYFDIQDLGDQTINGGPSETRERRELAEPRRVFLVKESVVDYIEELHRHPDCTDYLHDMLHLIYNEMVVVLSPTNKRISSGDLSRRVKAMHAKAVRDKDYLMKRHPFDNQFKIERKAAVEQPVNSKTLKMVEQMAKDLQHLQVFTGGRTESMTAEEFRSVQREYDAGGV